MTIRFLRSNQSSRLFLALSLLILTRASASTLLNSTPNPSDFKVSRIFVNQAKNIEVTITSSSWDCKTLLSHGDAAIATGLIYIGFGIKPNSDPNCVNSDKETGFTFSVPGGIPANNYLIQAMQYPSCDPVCSGTSNWYTNVGPIELDLAKLLKNQPTSIFSFSVKQGATAATSGYRDGKIMLALPVERAGILSAEVFSPVGKLINPASR